MNVTIKFDSNTQVVVSVDNKIIDELNNAYPEVAMMTAMEECNELAIAMSKCIRNGNINKRENLAEEIVDVLSVIQWAIRRFGISSEMLQKWYDEKHDRMVDRHKTDEVIFRTSEAKDKYLHNRKPINVHSEPVNSDSMNDDPSFAEIFADLTIHDNPDSKQIDKETSKFLNKIVNNAISPKKSKKKDKKSDKKTGKKDKKDKKSDKKGKGKK